ncbi:hypothetical protein RO3G_13372 [Rhizopus delemar RA 99-880]|uniref:Major facilitator superfamily (MFS) profile domain-containing protein n=5 Tax=Rhizopus TaxID=4842 RepID=I1CJN1_RHIO9|nr:hypothetical protein RO3G_13372 [Rhizopus delemar RA 99-880]KAG1637617.1 hypothetical protein G6F44_009236 [Rhizopus delemar]|eukprot:EIE88661.1 hypothetical protein RO3G_13372 [Rhizopus delemar RA 99-880]
MAEIDSSQIKFPAYMVYCVFIACLGSFSNGWVIGSPNVPGEITHHCLNGNAHVQNSLFPDCLPMDDALWGFAVASFCVGGLLGGLSGGMIQTRLGRKRTIMLNNLGFIFGGILIATAVNSSMFVVGRVLCGLSCGIASLTVPTYIGEISTIPSRGAMGTCNQFFIVIGILLSSVIGLPLATVSLWRVNYVIIAAPAIIQFFLMNTCVESPRYLVSINRIEEAKAILQKLRGKASIDVEFYDILEGSLGTAIAQLMIKQYGLSDTLKKDQEADINEELIVIPPQASETMNVIQVFMDPVIRRIALTVIGLHAFQQLVGINAVMYYSTTIFNLAFDQETSKYMTIITTAVNFVMTILAVVLVDRMGRRPLLLVANMGACLFCILLVIGYVYNIPALLVVSVFTYVASFAIGIGPIPWLITSELTPTYASSSVGSLGTCVNWSVNFLIGQCFPVIFAHIAGYSFVIFAVFAALSFLFTLFFLPETKGRSLESIVRGYERYRN